MNAKPKKTFRSTILILGALVMAITTIAANYLTASAATTETESILIQVSQEQETLKDLPPVEAEEDLEIIEAQALEFTKISDSANSELANQIILENAYISELKEDIILSNSKPAYEVLFDDVPTLGKFISEVSGSSGKRIVGVWAEGLFAFHVGGGSGNYVPDTKNTASTYGLAKKYDADVLLIHNYLGGTRLYQMDNRPVYVIYSDGSYSVVKFTAGYWYQTNKWSADGLSGNFRQWGCDCDFTLSPQDIFNIHYTGRSGLVFQTSIDTADSNGIVILEFNFIN